MVRGGSTVNWNVKVVSVGERRVEFSVDVADDSVERESTRLQRRDTPHHLKNKRVNTSTPPPMVDEDTPHHLKNKRVNTSTPPPVIDEDTPHHFKNKRVNTSTPPPVIDEDTTPQPATDDRVRRILARQIIGNALCESTSFDSGSSEHNDITAEVCSHLSSWVDVHAPLAEYENTCHGRSDIACVNQVTLRRARLVVGWVTNHLPT